MIASSTLLLTPIHWHKGRAQRASTVGRRGTTLVQILVVIGIIGILIAILFPLIARLRESSRDVICQGRLRSLAFASNSYRTEHKTYPRPALPAAVAAPQPPSLLSPLLPLVGGLLSPEKIDTSVLNQLAEYLGLAKVVSGTAAIDLPAELQSPDVERIEIGRGPFLSASGQSTYYTGFNYVLGLSTTTPANVASNTIRVLKPERLATTKSAKTIPVLWTDDVHGSPLGSPSADWQFTHAKSGATPGTKPLTYERAADCRGQHRAYVDGSTEWVPGDKLDLEGKTRQALDRSASYWAGGTYWWF